MQLSTLFVPTPEWRTALPADAATRVVTPWEFALELALPELLAQGVQPFEPRQGPALLQGWLCDQGLHAYSHPNWPPALWKQLEELWGQGQEPETAPLDAFHRWFEVHLRENRQADARHVYALALQLAPRSLYREVSDVRWTPSQRRFLDRLPGIQAHPFVPSATSVKLPAPSLTPPDEGAEAVLAIHLLTEEGWAFDQLTLALARPGGLSALLHQLEVRGIPHTCEMGRPFVRSRPGRALADLLHWIESDFCAIHLRSLLLSDLWDAPERCAAVLDGSGAAWGKDALKASLAGDSLEERWLRDLLDAIPENAFWSEWLHSICELLETSLRLRDAEDASALRALREEARHAAACRVHCVRATLSLLTSLAFASNLPEPGRLHVTSLEKAHLARRACVVVLGATAELEPEQALLARSGLARLPGQIVIAANLTPTEQPDEAPVEPYPHLRRGREAELARRSPAFTAYDGLVPAAAGVPGPLSPTRLQNLAACPFRFWLESVLQLVAVRACAPPPSGWLNPIARGHILHEVFASYGRRLMEENRPADAADGPWLEKTLESQLDHYARTAPPRWPAARASARHSLGRLLEEFLRSEVALARRVLAVELPFALDLSIAEEQTLSLRGQIDRINLVGDGLEVVDFKTGSSLPGDDSAVFAGGRLLQHAVYGRSAELLHDRPWAASRYQLLAARSRRPTRSFSAEQLAHWPAVLRQVLEPLRTGQFPVSQNRSEDCVWCRFAPACRAEESHPASTPRFRALLEEVG